MLITMLAVTLVTSWIFLNKKNQIHGTFPSNEYIVPISAVQVGGALWRVKFPGFTLKIHPGTLCYKLLDLSAT